MGWAIHSSASLAALLMLCAAQSYGQEQASGSGSGDRLPGSVNDFFARAVDEGLLPLSSSGESQDDPSAQAVTAPFRCPQEQTISFDEFEDLRLYAQLVRFTTGMRGRDDSSNRSSPASLMDAMRGQIALGLYSEVVSQTKNAVEPDERALAAIARFLATEGEQGGSYLQQLYQCSPEGDFWTSIVAVSNSGNTAQVDINGLVAGYRRLPFKLRVDVSAIVLPALIDDGQNALATSMMATFDEADFSASAKLRFLDAALDVKSNKPGGFDALRRQMRHPQLRDAAINLLARHRAPVSQAEVDVLKSEIAPQFAALRDEAERFALIDFWVLQAELRNDLSIFYDLLEVPALADPVAREKLSEGLAGFLKERLVKGETGEAVSILSLLASDSPLALLAQGDPAVMSTAVAFATGSEMPALAHHLAGKSQEPLGPELLLAARLQKARWALTSGDYQSVFETTLTAPRSQELNDLAVRGALRAGEEEILNNLLASASPSPEQALVWLEEETLSGQRMLPREIMALASRAEGADLERRYQALLALRPDLDAEADAVASNLSLDELVRHLETEASVPVQGG